MVRSKDLDTIAPDDPIITPQQEKKIDPPKQSPVKKTEKKNKEDLSVKVSLKQKAYNILGHTKSPFSSLLINPKYFNFSEKKEDEEILLAIRPHWATNLKWIFISILMIFAPFIVSTLKLFISLPLKYQLVSSIFWYLIIFIYAFEKFLDWYFDVFIITDQRLVDIKFNNLLNKHFAQAQIRVIQDISSTVKGVFATFFNFGTVLIQTAADVNQIIFTNVPNPEKVIKLLQELRSGCDVNYPGGQP